MSLQPPFLAQRSRSTGFFTFYNLSSLSLSLGVAAAEEDLSISSLSHRVKNKSLMGRDIITLAAMLP